MPPLLKRLYDLPGLTTATTQLAGAYTVFDVPLGPVPGGYKTMRCTPEELAAYLADQGLLGSGGTAPITATELTPDYFYISPALYVLGKVALRWLHLDGSATALDQACTLTATHLQVINRPADGSTLAYVDASGGVVPVPGAVTAASQLAQIDVSASAAAGVHVAVTNGRLVFSLSGTPPATSPIAVAVSAQRQATLSNLPAGSTATDYEYQLRGAPTVSAQRVADLSPILASGEAATDYEYQVHS